MMDTRGNPALVVLALALALLAWPRLCTLLLLCVPLCALLCAVSGLLSFLPLKSTAALDLQLDQYALALLLLRVGVLALLLLRVDNELPDCPCVVVVVVVDDGAWVVVVVVSKSELGHLKLEVVELGEHDEVDRCLCCSCRPRLTIHRFLLLPPPEVATSADL